MGYALCSREISKYKYSFLTFRMLYYLYCSSICVKFAFKKKNKAINNANFNF